MTNRKKILALATICFVLVVGCFFAFGEKPNYEGMEKAREVGGILSDAANNLANAREENPLIRVTVDGESEIFSEEYFTVRVSLWKAFGVEDPVESAINSMKKETVEKQFALKYGLMPTEEEISEYVQTMRDQVSTDEEASAIADELISSMGFTQDYYWEEYKPKYEAPAALTHEKVGDYILENGLKELDVENADYEIINEERLQSIRSEYNDN